ncbi:MAG: hypothetical protein II942_01580 [Alphaproteobacteria bacterium]|nr:hypothetical protein [Alphaproteobacteria bacterium]
MRTLSVLICAGSVLLASFNANADISVSRGVDNASTAASNAAKSTSADASSKGSGTQKSKKNDQAAAINMAAGAVATVAGFFINTSVLGETLASAWDGLWGTTSVQVKGKEVNCPNYAGFSALTASCMASCTLAAALCYPECYQASFAACFEDVVVPDPVTGTTHTFLVETDPNAAVCVATYEMTYAPLLPTAPNLMSMMTSAVRIATDMFLAEANKILASFAGEEGHVTDQWVGPPNRNKIVQIMGDVAVKSQKFGLMKFDSKEYEGLKDASSASPRELMEYRAETLVNDQRSLTSNSVENYTMRYKAQQRSIRALATAMQLKQSLKELSEADGLIDAEYGTKPQALNTAASRRVLYDALTELKMNVVAARLKLRSEALELNFDRISENPVTDSDDDGPLTSEVPLDTNSTVGD